jgi:acylphosphatase
MRARRYRIVGRVQGVGFRYFVWREAESLGIDGWVRNLADGTVEALGRGTSEKLDRFQDRLQEGPRWSRVTSVSVIDEPDEDVAQGFEIRRDGV